jgi:ubiquinone/menaquinone biosynthesis C-methylase UbiE
MLSSFKKKALSAFNSFIRKVAIKSHKAEMNFEWSNKRTPPRYFNHYHDLYFQWQSFSEYSWLERGIFNAFFIKDNAKVLELCSGDGFNTKYFYSKKAAQVMAIDIEGSAIEYSKKNNQTSNIEYAIGDITKELPGNGYDNIIIDAAIEQLSFDQQQVLLENIKKVIKTGGKFTGQSVQKKDDTTYHGTVKNEFRSPNELKSFLLKYFAFAEVIDNTHNGKTLLYFMASDAPMTLSGN